MHRAERIAREITEELTGQGFTVNNWHLNGVAEPIETWFNDNDWEIEEDER